MVHSRKIDSNLFIAFVAVCFCSTVLVWGQDTADKSSGIDVTLKEENAKEVDQGETQEDFWEDLLDQGDITPDAEDIPDWQARWELARVLGYQDKYTEALEEYRKVLKEKPDKPKIKIEMAYLYYYNGNSEKAEELLAEVNNKNVEGLPPEEKLILADILVSAKKYDQAIDLYETIMEEHGSRSQVRYHLARVLSWAERYEESLEQYRKILKKRPNDKSVRRHYAQVLTWAGKHEKAAEEFRKSLENNGNGQ